MTVYAFAYLVKWYLYSVHICIPFSGGKDCIFVHLVQRVKCTDFYPSASSCVCKCIPYPYQNMYALCSGSVQICIPGARDKVYKFRNLVSVAKSGFSGAIVHKDALKLQTA